MKHRISLFFHKIQQVVSTKTASRRVMLLAGGTVVGQVIHVLVTPILSRLYTPSDFGVLAVYSALLSILGAFSSFSYHWAIPLPEDDDSAWNLFVLSLLLQSMLSVILFLFFALVGIGFFDFFGWEPMAKYKWFLPLGVLVTGTYTIISYYALRKEAYSVLARTKISQKCLGALVSVSLGFWKGPVGLIWGQIVGMSGGILALLRASVKEPLKVTGKSLLKTAQKYKDFPMYHLWGALVNVLSVQMMPLLLFSFFSQEITGWFSMSYRVVQLPMAFLGQAIAQVFYQRASLAYRNGILKETTLKTVGNLLKIGTFPIFSLGIVAPTIFPLLFGTEWGTAGVYSLILSPFIWLQFLASPVSGVFWIVNKQKCFLLFQIVMVFLGMGSLFLGYLIGGIYCPIIIYSIGKMIVYFSYLTLILHISGVKAANFSHLIVREIIVSLLFLGPICIAALITPGTLITIYIWFIVGVIYLLYFTVVKNKSKSETEP